MATYISYQATPNWRDGTWEIVEAAKRIISAFRRKGFDLTLRQLYYQFVATQPLRAEFKNSERNYKKLGRIVSEARMCGELDWDAIVDRTRTLRGVSHWDSPESIIESSARGYRIDKWEDQANRVEVWIEKDALVGVIANACRRLDVDYFSCRGYASQSAMWRAAQRLRRYNDAGQHVTILHLGDHDPSGIDMTRDIEDRLWTFQAMVDVDRIALNMAQVQQFGPPPNPTKLTDSRAVEYISNYGMECWELDALDPETLERLVEENVRALRDDDVYAEAQEREQVERDRLRLIADRYDDVVAFLEDAD